MAPFRAARSTRSGRPGNQNDQDIFDGLPIRQWRVEPSTIAGPEDAAHATGGPAPDAPIRGKGIWVEYPLPKGSEHYPVWAQQILREARLGRIVSASQSYQRPVFGRVVVRDEDKENETTTVAAEVDEGPTASKNVRTAAQAGFIANRWTLTPRQAEEPEVEYLAKRRKGLPSIHGAAGASHVTAPVAVTSNVGVVAVAPGTMPVNSGTLIRIKVKRVDAQGQARIWEVLRPEGHPIDGEINEATMSIEDAALPIEKPASGTTVEGLGVAGDDGAIIASFSAIPTLSANAGPIPPRGPRRKQKGGFRKGRSKKLGVGDAGGVSASAEALYALEAKTAYIVDDPTMATDVDGDVENTFVTVDGQGEGEGEGDGDEGSEDGEIEEDEGEGEGEEAEGDAMGDGEDDEDGDGDGDREEGELTPDPGEIDDMPEQSSVRGTLATLQSGHPSLPPRPQFPTTSNGVSARASIEELATEPSLPVGAELTEPLSPGETESSYNPPDLDAPFGERGLEVGEVDAIEDSRVSNITSTPYLEEGDEMRVDAEPREDALTGMSRDGVNVTAPFAPITGDVHMSNGADLLPEDDEDYEPPPVMIPLTTEQFAPNAAEDLEVHVPSAQNSLPGLNLAETPAGNVRAEASAERATPPVVAPVDPSLGNQLDPVKADEALDEPQLEEVRAMIPDPSKSAEPPQKATAPLGPAGENAAEDGNTAPTE